MVSAVLAVGSPLRCGLAHESGASFETNETPPLAGAKKGSPNPK